VQVPVEFVKSIDLIYKIRLMNLSTFDLNLLKVLDALLRERSTVRAGDRLGLSQPAVSAALGRLRHALGDPLFVRQGQGLVPTSRALDLESGLRHTLDALDALLSGPAVFDPALARLDFRISGTDFFAAMLMPALVGAVRADAPGVRLQLVDLVPDNYIAALDSHEVDIALLPEREFPSWIDHRPLFRAEFAAIARIGHPALRNVPPGDILPLDLFCDLGHVLCSPDGRFHGLGDAALARVGRSRRVLASVPVFEGVFDIVRNSELIALVPLSLALARAGRGGFEIFRPPVPVDPPVICMIWHRRLTGDPAHRWIRTLVAEMLRPLELVTHSDGASVSSDIG